MTGPSDPTRARERRRDLGETSPRERGELAARFGPVLRAERGWRTQAQLAHLVGCDRATIVRLEGGWRRPTTSIIWKIARALRTDLRSRVALDERLRAAAGDSLRDYGRRPHARREEMRLRLRLECGDGPPAGRQDTNLGAMILADLARHSTGGPTREERDRHG